MSTEIVKHETASLKRYRVKGSIRLEVDESDIEALTPAEAVLIAVDEALGTRYMDVEAEEYSDVKAEERQ